MFLMNEEFVLVSIILSPEMGAGLFFSLLLYVNLIKRRRMALTSKDPLMTYVLLYFGKYQAIKDTDEYGATYLVNTWYPVGFAY